MSKFRGRQESRLQNQTSASSDQPNAVLPAASTDTSQSPLTLLSTLNPHPWGAEHSLCCHQHLLHPLLALPLLSLCVKERTANFSDSPIHVLPATFSWTETQVLILTHIATAFWPWFPDFLLSSGLSGIFSMAGSSPLRTFLPPWPPFLLCANDSASPPSTLIECLLLQHSFA